MKKISTIAVIPALILMLMGCGNLNFEAFSAPKEASEAASVDLSNLSDDVVVYKGKPISVFDEMSSALDVLGKPTNKSHNLGMYFYGFDDNSIQINAVDADETTYLTRVVIIDQNGTTARGITVGSTKEDVLNAYGDPSISSDFYDQSYNSTVTSMTYKFDDDKYRVDFLIANGKVVNLEVLNMETSI